MEVENCWPNYFFEKIFLIVEFQLQYLDEALVFSFVKRKKNSYFTGYEY